MNIIKTLKSSISEKGNYCYSLPVETTKEIIKDVKQLQQGNQKYKETFDKAIKLIDYYGIKPEENDNMTLRHILKNFKDILKEVE